MSLGIACTCPMCTGRHPHGVYEQAAMQQLTTLLLRYPDAIPVLRDAVLSGRIAGRMWGGEVDGAFYGCFIGWIARAYRRGAEALNAEVLYHGKVIAPEVAYFADFPSPVVPGETPATSSRLCLVLEIIEQVEEELARRAMMKPLRYAPELSTPFVPHTFTSWKWSESSSTAPAFDVVAEVKKVLTELPDLVAV